MMLIKLFIFFLLLLILPDLVYIQSLHPSCITKMDSPGLLDTNIISGHRDDGDFLYPRANARFHVPAQQFSVDIPMLCRT